MMSDVSLSGADRPSMLYAITTAPAAVGKWSTGRGISFKRWFESGASLAPKSTVPAFTCWIPAPEPIDW